MPTSDVECVHIEFMVGSYWVGRGLFPDEVETSTVEGQWKQRVMFHCSSGVSGPIPVYHSFLVRIECLTCEMPRACERSNYNASRCKTYDFEAFYFF